VYKSCIKKDNSTKQRAKHVLEVLISTNQQPPNFERVPLTVPNIFLRKLTRCSTVFQSLYKYEANVIMLIRFNNTIICLFFLCVICFCPFIWYQSLDLGLTPSREGPHPERSHPQRRCIYEWGRVYVSIEVPKRFVVVGFPVE